MEVFHWREAPPADFAVIGDPIKHSLSPLMQHAALQALGLEEKYVAIKVESGQVSQALDHLKGLGYKGINCTIPHKTEAMEWALPSPDSQEIGAINTIRLDDRTAINTDAPGFLSSLKSIPGFAPTAILVLGAGGSARAIFYALSSMTSTQIDGWNRTKKKLELLKAEVCPNLNIVERPFFSQYDLIVDATAATALGAQLEIPWTNAKPNAVFYSLMYGSPTSSQDQTPLLRRAQVYGFRTIDGRTLLAEQGVLSLRFWHPELTAEQVSIALQAMKSALNIGEPFQ